MRPCEGFNVNLKYSNIRIYQIKIHLDITTNNKYKQ